MMNYWWLLLAVIFFVGEAVTVGFFVFWFGVGALVALLASLFIDSLAVQSVLFLSVSIVLLFFTRPLVNKFLLKSNDVKTNAYSVEGKKGRVNIEINPIEGTGQVKIAGELWSAKSNDDSVIPVDTDIIVEKIDGVKLIVTPIKTEQKI